MGMLCIKTKGINLVFRNYLKNVEMEWKWNRGEVLKVSIVGNRIVLGVRERERERVLMLWI